MGDLRGTAGRWQMEIANAGGFGSIQVTNIQGTAKK